MKIEGEVKFYGIWSHKDFNKVYPSLKKKSNFENSFIGMGDDAEQAFNDGFVKVLSYCDKNEIPYGLFNKLEEKGSLEARKLKDRVNLNDINKFWPKHGKNECPEIKFYYVIIWFNVVKNSTNELMKEIIKENLTQIELDAVDIEDVVHSIYQALDEMKETLSKYPEIFNEAQEWMLQIDRLLFNYEGNEKSLNANVTIHQLFNLIDKGEESDEE